MPFEMKYPYTDLEHLNLDWIYNNMKKLLDDYSEIMEWIENDASNYDKLLGRMNTLENQARSLQQQILQLNNSLQDQYNRITSEYHALYDTIIIQFNSIISDVIHEMYTMQTDLINRITAGDTAVMSYVTAQLDTFIENLPDYEHLIIFNPVRGEQTTVQIAINDLYNEFNVYALTASEYDNLELTADQYDSMDLTAYDYDHYGQRYLSPDSPFVMRDPFTGEMTAVKNVVYELVDLHRLLALTADDYDALDLTADDYDALDLTAYDYDFHGVTP